MPLNESNKKKNYSHLNSYDNQDDNRCSPIIMFLCCIYASMIWKKKYEEEKTGNKWDFNI